MPARVRALRPARLTTVSNGAGCRGCRPGRPQTARTPPRTAGTPKRCQSAGGRRRQLGSHATAGSARRSSQSLAPRSPRSQPLTQFWQWSTAHGTHVPFCRLRAQRRRSRGLAVGGCSPATHPWAAGRAGTGCRRTSEAGQGRAGRRSHVLNTSSHSVHTGPLSPMRQATQLGTRSPQSRHLPPRITACLEHLPAAKGEDGTAGVGRSAVATSAQPAVQRALWQAARQATALLHSAQALAAHRVHRWRSSRHSSHKGSAQGALWQYPSTSL